jgi:thioesterase domain-containing protein
MSASLLVAELRELGVRLQVVDGRLLCDAPTGVLDERLRKELAAHKPELIALLSGAKDALEGAQSIVPLKPAGSLSPLFARPGHNGDVFCYRARAAHIDAGRPLHGVEPRGLDGSPVAATLEEMAAYEVEQIRRVEPRGPYYLAGYCAGGTIAFEVAQQLARAGKKVVRLILFAAPFPTTYRTSEQVSSGLRNLADRVQRHAAALTTGTLSERIEYVRSRAQGLQADRSAEAERRADPALANRIRVEDATLEAVRLYEPRPYAGRVDLLCPSEAWRRSDDRPDLWRQVVSDLVVHVGPVDCSGDDILREPHVRAVAAWLGPVLDGDEGARSAKGREG